MRYVKKARVPRFFKHDSRTLRDWKKYKSYKKRKLKQYILEKEQDFLCIYCEGKVSIGNSHVEHLRPKDSAKYPEQTFNYKNLSVSCNGYCHEFYHDNQPRTCGHIKGNMFNEKLFLDPTKVENIEEYFKYDYDTGEILSSGLQDKKANYMIYDILHLNDPAVCIARRRSLKIFQEKLSKLDKSIRKEKLLQILENGKVPYISYLRYRFRHIK